MLLIRMPEPRTHWVRKVCRRRVCQVLTGEMWNSNSVISWLLIRSGIGVHGIVPPSNGRAPRWTAGVTVADRGAASMRRRLSLGRFVAGQIFDV